MATEYTKYHAVKYDSSTSPNVTRPGNVTGVPFRPYVASTLPCKCVLHDRPLKGSLHVVYAGGGRIDFPIKVGDRILYDWPEAIPQAAKRLVERAFAAAAS